MSTEQQTREIKARYLKAGMTMLFGDERLTVGTVHRYATDTVLVYIDGDPDAMSYHVEEGVTVFGDATVPPTPDCWLTLADELRQAADRFATLAGTSTRPAWTSLSLRCGNSHEYGEPEAIALVDKIAAAFGTTAEVGRYGVTDQYHTIVGGLDEPLQVRAHTPPPFGTDPRDAEILRLRAELKARLAEGGAS